MERQQKKSESALKIGRRLILTGYVLSIIVQVLMYLNVFAHVYERLIAISGSAEHSKLIYPMLLNILPLLFIISGFLALKRHSNPLLKLSSKLLLFAIVFQVVMVGLFGFLNNYISANFGLSSVYFIAVLLSVLIANFPFIYAYSYLMSCTGIDYRRTVILCICVLITSSVSMVNYVIMAMAQPHDSVIIAMARTQGVSFPVFNTSGPTMTAILILINVVYYKCWKQILRTPSRIALEEDSLPRISFRPCRIETGYLVSCVIFMIITSVAVYTLY